MATEVSICSNACLMLGAETFASFNDDLPRASLAANLFPQLRPAVLRANNWNCATKRLLLAPDIAAPPFDYSMQFSLPSDWLRTIRVGEYGRELDHKPEGRKILCDTNPLPIVFVFDNTNVGSWDAMLVHSMSLTMAAAMAYAITKSTSLGEAKLNEALAFMAASRGVDGQDAPAETLGDFRLFMSRKISRV